MERELLKSLLHQQKVSNLRSVAKKLNLNSYSKLKKTELVNILLPGLISKNLDEIKFLFSTEEFNQRSQTKDQWANFYSSARAKFAKIFSWKIMSHLITAIVGAIATVLIQNWSSPPPLPEFQLEKTLFHPDSIMRVYALNESARENDHLIVLVEGIESYGVGTKINTDENSWIIDLGKLNLPKDILNGRLFEICFGFSRQRMSYPKNIAFDTSPPSVQVNYARIGLDKVLIRGQYFDTIPLLEQKTSVTMLVSYQKSENEIRLVPTSSYDKEKDRRIYDFGHTIHDYSRVLRLNLFIEDEAGNRVIHTLKHDDFFTIDSLSFKNDLNNPGLVKQKYNPLPEVQYGKSIEVSSKNFIYGDPQIILDGDFVKTDSRVQLKWRIDPRIHIDVQSNFIIERSGNAIASTPKMEFMDKVASGAELYYQVIMSNKGQTYKSNLYFTSDTSMLIPMTVDLIYRYRLKHRDFGLLRYYLENKLSLQKEYTVGGEHRMMTSEVIFEEMAEGMLVRTRQNMWYFWTMRPASELSISFEANDNDHYLVFRPNIQGEYTLDVALGLNSIQYGNESYDCVEGCYKNRLLVFGRFIRHDIIGIDQ